MSGDGGSVISDLLKDLKGAWSSRVSNPLTGAFAVSWLAVNYRFLVVLLSEEGFKTKFSYVETVLYPTVFEAVIRGFCLPLVIALAYIYILPAPTEMVYRWTLDRQRRLNKIAREVAGARMLDHRESEDLLKKVQAEEDRIQQERIRIKSYEDQLEQSLKSNGLALEAERQRMAGEMSELQERHRAEMEVTGRQVANLKSQLTLLYAMAIDNLPVKERRSRLVHFLTARKLTVIRDASQELGSLKFSESGSISAKESREFDGWVSWSMGDDLRLIIMDGEAREIGILKFESSTMRWLGEIYDRDIYLISGIKRNHDA